MGGTDKRYTAACHKCGKQLQGQPQVLWPGKYRLCVSCVTDLQRSNGVPGQLDRFVTWYRESMQPRTVQTLQAQLDKVLAMLAEKGIDVEL